MIRDAIAEIEDDAAAMRGHQFRPQDTLVVQNAVHPGRVDMGDDIAALEQRQNGAQRRVVLPDMDHDRQVERRRRFLGAAQSLKIVRAATLSDKRALTPITTSRFRAIAACASATSAALISCNSPPGAMTPVRAILTRQRPICGAPRATAATASILSAPPVPASTQPVTPS